MLNERGVRLSSSLGGTVISRQRRNVTLTRRADLLAALVERRDLDAEPDARPHRRADDRPLRRDGNGGAAWSPCE